MKTILIAIIMKKQRRMKKTAQSQSREGIKDASTGMYRLLVWFETMVSLIRSRRITDNPSGTSAGPQKLGTCNFIIPLSSNGPPGRSRSPGNRSDLTPDNTLSIFKNSKILNIKQLHYLNMNNIYNFYQHLILNFYQLLILKNMKKQVFILIVALLCAVTSYGQVGNSVPGSAPRPISCTDDPLHPIAGRPYIYKALSSPAGNYTFWATKNTDFIVTNAGVTTNNLAGRLTTPTDLIQTSGNYGAPSATDNVQITWSDAVLSATDPATSPTFVAALTEATGTNCANNFNAWQLVPINAFTVDIQNMDHTTKAAKGYDAAGIESQCFDMVRSAAWNAGQMQYNFGTNVLYFEVVAANFTGSWTPTFNLSGLINNQTAVIEWDVVKTFTNPVTVTSGVASATPVTTTETNTSTGVSIYVRVTVSNNRFEGLAATPITLAVDGQNSVGKWDVINATCTETTGVDQNDTAIQTLDPRPTLTPVAPSAPFVPGDQL
jgi:hypothetical protein